MITLTRLQTFCAVAECRSYTRAAEQLFISQPYAYAQVRDLERTLGVKLIEQVGKVSHLTDSGRVLYEYGSRILELLGAAEVAMREAKNDERGYLYLGTSPCCASQAVAELLTQCRAVRPHMIVKLVEMSRETIEQMLLNRELDIGIFAGSSEVPGLVQQEWFTEDLVLVAPAGHPLTVAPETPARLLQESPFISFPQSVELGSLTEDWLAAASISVEPVLEVSTNSAAIEAVAAGLGFSIIPRRFVATPLEQGRIGIIGVTPSPLPVTYYLTWLADRTLPSSASALVKLVTVKNEVINAGPKTESTGMPQRG